MIILAPNGSCNNLMTTNLINWRASIKVLFYGFHFGYFKNILRFYSDYDKMHMVCLFSLKHVCALLLF